MSETQVKIVTSNKSEIFDIFELPDPKSQLIKAECSKIKNDVNLQGLVSDFSQLCELIRLAENGAVNCYQIQIQIRDIGRIITRLVGDTSLAIHSFEKASAEVTEALKTAYEYLFSSFEEEALITLAGIEEIAKEMLDTSEKLKNNANNACNGVKEVSNAVRRRRGEGMKNKENIDKEREQYKLDEKAWKGRKYEYQEELNNLETQINAVNQKIERSEKSAHNWMMVETLSIFIPGRKMTKNAKEQAEIDRKEKKQLIEEQRRQIESRRIANDQIATFALKMQRCKDQSDLLETVTDSLHNSVSALNNIEGVMETARIFWERMYMHCKKLTSEGLRNKVMNSLYKYDEEKRLKLFKSPPFKREAINVYAEWVALRVTCLRHKSQIDANHRDFLEYLKESPNRDQSYAIVEDLAIKLKERIENVNRTLKLEESKIDEQEANLETDIQANTSIRMASNDDF